jgi:hypothetical protein
VLSGTLLASLPLANRWEEAALVAGFHGSSALFLLLAHAIEFHVRRTDAEHGPGSQP